ncbi:hypothetical protein PM082_020041 [Marasmius tenuissimus]|nr:hypothetical protein PM082_020041 [Marasmius tenuissimus]
MATASGLALMKPIFIGNIFQSCLVGMVTTQALVFLGRPVSRWNKVICIIIWSLMILHLISIVTFSYKAIFVSKGNMEGAPIGWDYSLMAILDLLIANITQIFYAVRLWKVMKNPRSRLVVFSFLGLLLAFSLGLDIYIPVEVHRVPEITKLLHINFKWAVIVSFFLTPAIDSIVSVALIISLHKTETRMDWTDNQFFVVIAYVVNTGAIASIYSIICPIAYVRMPDNFVWLALRNVLTPLYLNCLFAMLNAQHYLENWSGSHSKDVYVYNGSGFRQRSSSQPLSPNKGTINEVGLPLFNQQTNKMKIGMNDIPLVEVNVAHESAHQSDRNNKGFYRNREISEMPVSTPDSTKAPVTF